MDSGLGSNYRRGGAAIGRVGCIRGRDFNLHGLLLRQGNNLLMPSCCIVPFLLQIRHSTPAVSFRFRRRYHSASTL